MPNRSKRRGRVSATFALPVLLTLTACAPPANLAEPTPAPGAVIGRVTAPIPLDDRESPPPNDREEARRAAKAASVIRETGTQPVGGQTASRGTGMTGAGDITLNFVDADIHDIARQILGGILRVNYTIDPAVRGALTLQTTAPLHREDLIPTLDALLSQNNAGIIERDGAFRILPLEAASVGGPVGGPGIEGAGSEVVPLRFASATRLVELLAPYVQNAKITPEPGRNILVISGTSTVRRTLIDLVRIFDVDYLAGQSYALIPVSAGAVAKIASDLENLLLAESGGALAGAVHVFPLDEANAVLVTAREPRYLDRAERFLAHLETMHRTTARSMHVYFVQNGEAADLVPVLREAFMGSASGGSARGGEVTPTSQSVEIAAQPSQPPVFQPASGPSSAPGAAAALVPSGPPTPAGSASDADVTSTGAGDRSDATRGDPSSGAAAKQDTIRIVANKKNNALLIYANETEYESIAETLRKIDIVPVQVMIEATIAEVTLNDALKYGTQFFFKSQLGGVTLSNGNIGPVSNTDFTIINQSASYSIEALRNVSTVKVLSAPQVLVLNNEQARLQVGDLVPIQTQSAQSTLTSGAPIVSSIEYRETGIILTVTPRVSTGGLVTLDIQQEVSSVENTTTSQINSPSFQERKIHSRVAVNDAQTVGLAGLISDNAQKSNNGIPYLQDIPVLGAAFGNVANQYTRTELLVLMTPHIVRGQRDLHALTDELRRRLKPGSYDPSLPLQEWPKATP